MKVCELPPPYQQADQLEVARLDASKVAAERERREELERQRVERHKQDQVRVLQEGGGGGTGAASKERAIWSCFVDRGFPPPHPSSLALLPSPCRNVNSGSVLSSRLGSA